MRFFSSCVRVSSDDVAKELYIGLVHKNVGYELSLTDAKCHYSTRD